METLFIIDPLDTLNLETETSLLLIEELARRGHGAAVAGVADLYLTDTRAGVHARSISIDLARRPFYQLGPQRDCACAEFPLILMRKDPPVDAAFMFATHVLERASADTLVVNSPAALRMMNEKLLALRFSDLSPPTVVSHDVAQLKDFARRHGRVVLKPLSDCSGRGVRIVDSVDAAAAIDAAFAQRAAEALLVQRFVPGVVHGDKRIFLLNGAPIGAVNRIPSSANHLANIHQGARVAATEITPREHEICATLQPVLRQHGLWMAGIDVIDGLLTEVNVTSPSAVRQINAVSGTHLEVTIVDFLERLQRNWPAAPGIGFFEPNA